MTPCYLKGEMSLELLKHMKHDYVQTRHSIINKERMNKIFNDLSNGLDVRVIVFGGSFTAGRQGGGINHAWPNRLQNMWNESTNIAHTTKGKTSSFTEQIIFIFYLLLIPQVNLPYQIMLSVQLHQHGYYIDCLHYYIILHQLIWLSLTMM